MQRLKKVAKGLGILLGLLVPLAVIAGVAMHESRPSGEPGEGADALAREVQDAVGQAAWDDARYVAFDFAGRMRHRWDRERGLAYVTWGDLPAAGPGENEVWLRLGDRSGVVHVAGQRVRGEEADELLAKAWGRHINDTFWLFPFRTFFDEGVTRSLVGDDLLIEYASGGATPGDAYLWHLGNDGRPTGWEMWVSIIPIGGVDASWTDWEERAGVHFATRHSLGPMTLELTDIAVGELPTPDPFAPLF